MKELSVLNWPALSRQPIVHALLLSACLHLALTALIQPTPGSGMARTVVINASLETVAPPNKSEAPVPTPPPPSPPRGSRKRRNRRFWPATSPHRIRSPFR